MQSKYKILVEHSHEALEKAINEAAIRVKSGNIEEFYLPVGNLTISADGRFWVQMVEKRTENRSYCSRGFQGNSYPTDTQTF